MTQVSVLLLKNPYETGKTVEYDGVSTNDIPDVEYLKLHPTDSGTVTFELPAAYANKKCGTDYYAYILAEDVNAGVATDYASPPVSITIPDPIFFTVEHGTSKGSYMQDDSVAITADAPARYLTGGLQRQRASPLPMQVPHPRPL